MIVIIDTGLSNIASVLFALERIGAKVKVSTDPVEIQSASHVVLPGVGSASAAMERLSALGLIETIRGLRQPVLGICLGMQLLFESSEEGEVRCLNVIPGKVKKLLDDPTISIPHIGWNTLEIKDRSALLSGINDGDYVYYLHSYVVSVSEVSCAVCQYGKSFTAVCQYKNFYGAQFHPERSSKVGEILLQNFVRLK